MLRSAAALASVLLAAGVGAAEPPETTLRGAALFRGEGLRAALPAMGGLRLEGPAAACARCHGEDARGLLEGGVAAPPLP
jgi:cytochrome c553